MFYLIQNGNARRVLKPFDIEGGKWVIKNSFAIIVGSDCPDPMYPADITGLDCSSVQTYNVSKNEKLFIFPNPVHDFLTIQVPEAAGDWHLVEIFDNIGRKISYFSYNQLEIKDGIQINLNHFAAGSYIVKIWMNESSFSTVKIIKQ